MAIDMTPGLQSGQAPLLEPLLERIVDQDESALAMLYQLMLAKVYGLALRVTGCAQTAEEVAEDTFWQVWRQAPRFDPERGTAAAWILTIARSRALDALRKTDPMIDKEASADEAWAQISAPLGDTPPELLDAMQQGHDIQMALQRLEPLPRQLVALAFFRGFSHEEIAWHTGLPLGTVKSHIRRALSHLKQTLSSSAGIQV